MENNTTQNVDIQKQKELEELKAKVEAICAEPVNDSEEPTINMLDNITEEDETPVIEETPEEEAACEIDGDMIESDEDEEYDIFANLPPFDPETDEEYKKELSEMLDKLNEKFDDPQYSVIDLLNEKNALTRALNEIKANKIEIDRALATHEGMKEAAKQFLATNNMTANADGPSLVQTPDGKTVKVEDLMQELELPEDEKKSIDEFLNKFMPEVSKIGECLKLIDGRLAVYGDDKIKSPAFLTSEYIVTIDRELGKCNKEDTKSLRKLHNMRDALTERNEPKRITSMVYDDNTILNNNASSKLSKFLKKEMQKAKKINLAKKQIEITLKTISKFVSTATVKKAYAVLKDNFEQPFPDLFLHYIGLQISSHIHDGIFMYYKVLLLNLGEMDDEIFDVEGFNKENYLQSIKEIQEEFINALK